MKSFNDIKQHKKFLMVLMIILILVSTWITSVYLINTDSNGIEWHRIDTYQGYWYNGTRYPAIDFRINNFKDEGGVFTVSLFISLEGYNGSIKVTNENEIIYIPVDNEDEENGSYHISGLYLTPKKSKGEYPQDFYKCNITLETVNDEGFPLLNSIKYHYNQSGWHIYIYGLWEKLYFTFNRTSDVLVYEILVTWGIVSLIISIFSLLTWIIILQNENDYITQKLRFLGNAVYFASNIFAIPFFPAVLIDYIISRIPTHSGYHIEYLLMLIISLIILQSGIYAIRQKFTQINKK